MPATVAAAGKKRSNKKDIACRRLGTHGFQAAPPIQQSTPPPCAAWVVPVAVSVQVPVIVVYQLNKTALCAARCTSAAATSNIKCKAGTAARYSNTLIPIPIPWHPRSEPRDPAGPDPSGHPKRCSSCHSSSASALAANQFLLLRH